MSESKPEINIAAHCKGAAIAQQSRDRPLATAAAAGTYAAKARRQDDSGGRRPAVAAAASFGRLELRRVPTGGPAALWRPPRRTPETLPPGARQSPCAARAARSYQGRRGKAATWPVQGGCLGDWLAGRMGGIRPQPAPPTNSIYMYMYLPCRNGRPRRRRGRRRRRRPPAPPARQVHYSSYWVPAARADQLDRLLLLASLGLACPEMARRLHLTERVIR